MTSVRQSHVTTMSSSNHDNNLDALLEELQTSVSRPGSSLGHNHNGPVTGYREVTRTVTTESAGQPPHKTSEYQIEYLTPSNTTTVLQDVTPPHRDLSLMHDGQSGRNLSVQHDGQSGRNLSSYKTVQYQYNTSTSGSNLQDGAPPGADMRMRQNITELDSLLDDLHTAQKTGFADTSVSRHPAGIDPGLLEPLDSSTPRSGHVSRSVEKRTVQEQRYGSVGQNQNRDRERDVRKELVFTGGNVRRDQPSPTPPPPVAHKEVYRYETKTTRSGSNSRDLSPPQDRRQPSPARQLASVRTYNYTSSDEVPRTPTLHRSPSPSGVRSSSTTRNEVRQYNYSNRDFSPEGVRQPPLRSPSPTTKVTTVRNYSYTTPQEPPRNTSSKMTAVNSYSYNSSSRENRSPQDIPRSPPPHRSPSPVSFSSPPIPSSKTTVKTYNFEQSGNQPYQRPQSPQPVQKFSPSDPSRTLTYQVSPPPSQPPQPTVITYKYSSQTTHSSKYPGEEGAPLLPRPFPTPSPTPDQQQQPPKKLDELMASFSDTDIQHHHETSSRYVPVREPAIQRTEAPPRDAPPTPPPGLGPSPAATAAAMQVKSKNIAGPPVYYPPGVELFAKKEESMMQSQSGGYKAKAKAKYEYESSSKMKSKESSGKTVVPVCLPVCCAMPCVIM